MKRGYAAAACLLATLGMGGCTDPVQPLLVRDSLRNGMVGSGAFAGGGEEGGTGTVTTAGTPGSPSCGTELNNTGMVGSGALVGMPCPEDGPE